jgi:hypothetical protein
MDSKRSRRRKNTFEAAERDALGTEKCSEAAFRLDFRPDFQWPQLEVQKGEGDDRRRSVGVEQGEN